MQTLEDLVKEFLASSHICSCEDELHMFHGLPLEASIEKAALSEFDGKRHSHQCRLRKSTLLNTKAVLLETASRIRGVATFDELHELISAILNPVRGAGALYAYDVAVRIGASLSLEPLVVYLHAGTREGARHLGVRGEQAELSAFPKAMHRLTAAQAEDFLCIYKGQLAHCAVQES